MNVEAAPPSKINFHKIIENALSLVVTSVFIGACAIVWKGATTVEEKVHTTQQGLLTLIDNLSSKLSSYETQLDAQSNQLFKITLLMQEMHNPSEPLQSPPTEERTKRAIKREIQEQLNKSSK